MGTAPFLYNKQNKQNKQKGKTMLNKDQFKQWFDTNYLFNENGKIVGKKGRIL